MMMGFGVVSMPEVSACMPKSLGGLGVGAFRAQAFRVQGSGFRV